MKTGEKLSILKIILTNYAISQCQVNNIEPLEAVVVLEGVAGEFRRMALENALSGAIIQPEDPEKKTKNGTAEELIKDFKNTGFHPEGTK